MITEHGSASSRGAERAWPNDERVHSDGSRTFFAVADGAGPTYGGWHAPTGVDRALGVASEVWDQDRVADAVSAMRQAFAGANAATFDATWLKRPRAPKAPASHPTCSITALGLRAGRAAVGQVGNCRAYLLREGSLQLLVEEHTAERDAARRGGRLDDASREHHREVTTRLLGFGAEVTTDVWSAELAVDDVFLLCTSGIWRRLAAREILATLERCRPQEAADALVVMATADPQAPAASAVVVRVSSVSGPPGPAASP